MSDSSGFSEEQKSYLQGFALGSDVARRVHGLPILSGSAAPGHLLRLGQAMDRDQPVLANASPPKSGNGLPDPPSVDIQQWAAQEAQIAAGGKLCAEELAKRTKHPLDRWDEIQQLAAERKYPQGTDVFLQKYHGLFYVAPAQNSYMCRLRFPGGLVTSYQLRGLADLVQRFAGHYVDVTTRANLQLREIEAQHAVDILTGLRDLGIVNTGAGADNVRNVTASPLSGIDTCELIETLPLAREMHYYILHHRELYGLPRKFNIAFDGGGTISSLDETNDIGFHACRLAGDLGVGASERGEAARVYFKLALAGITGHGDFARPTNVLVRPDECVSLAAAILRVFIAHGIRTDRRRARLKYLLDEWGVDRFLDKVEQEWGRKLRRVDDTAIAADHRDVSTRHAHRWAHVGFHPQRRPNKHYVGVVLPVGRVTREQLIGLSRIAERLGEGEVRLTVWQNLIIPHIDTECIGQVQQQLESIGLDWRASAVRAGLVACTGNAGCKYAAANTKLHAMRIADFVDERLELDMPVNIHLTGCHHSCAQHVIADIGLLATGVEQGDDIVEGYHLYVGGGFGPEQCIGQQLDASLPFDKVPARVTRLLDTYQRHRLRDESMASFTVRLGIERLRSLLDESGDFDSSPGAAAAAMRTRDQPSLQLAAHERN